MGVFRVLGVSNGHRGKNVRDRYNARRPHLMASMRFRRVRAKVSSGIFMMGRMMGNCFRTHHEAFFLAKLLLPLLRQDFLYRRRFKAAVLHGHKIGHQKPKKPPILIVLVRFFVNSKLSNVRQSRATLRCVSLAASAYSSGLRQKVLFAPRRAYFT